MNSSETGEVAMKLSSALEAQSSVFADVFGYEEVPGAQGAEIDGMTPPVFVKPMAAKSRKLGVSKPEKQETDEMAVGIGSASPQPSDEFRLTVFVQRKSLAEGKLVEEIKEKARGEADIVYTGRIEPLQWFRQVCNPLRNGCSTGHFAIGAGTLGCFVRDNVTGREGILSNNHVLANVNQAQLGDDILQSGALDGGVRPGDVIATLSRFIAITLGGTVPNDVDCAFAEFATGHRPFDARTVWDGSTAGAAVGNPLSLTPVAQVLPGMAVEKTGRTTGHTAGSVRAINVNNQVVNMQIGLARFDGQIAFHAAPGSPRFSDRGDSGSLILSAQHEPMALLFSGSRTGGANGLGVTFGNPIQTVLNRLNVTII
jgi:hypothetical protein